MHKMLPFYPVFGQATGLGDDKVCASLMARDIVGLQKAELERIVTGPMGWASS
ncbi:hypothetical protein HAP94_22530 [Acidithiobacillus ferrivorans]|uniref:Uncharacterized protein n=1 Tax=mine drainage metagenome TaxID=410659 RepID=E6QJ70_9ZZZZ|nr:hypothetical protein [Acidithiobacillus ferrivorans]